LSTRLSPALGRHIVRQRLARLSGRMRLSETDLARLSRQLVARHYAAGEVILMEGVRGDCLGLVTRGQVAVQSSLADRGRPIELLRPGSTFGEAMLSAGQPSGGTLRAVTDAEVLFLRRADLLTVVAPRQPRPAGAISRWSRGLVVTILALLVIVASPLRQAKALVPYSAGLWLSQHGHADWAETAWALSRYLAPGWAAPHLSLGNLHLRRGQPDRARAELELALNLSPDLAEAHNSLGLLYAARGDHEAAIEAFRKALALEPGHAAVEANLAFSLQLAGRRDEALRHYALARSLDAPGSVLLTNEAIAHYETGDLAAAESAARQALDLDDTSAPACAVLGALYLTQGRPRAAESSLARAIRLDPAYGPAHFYLGLAYKALNEPSLAYAAFDYVVFLDHDPLARREAHRQLSELYDRHGTNLDRDQPYPIAERK